MVCNELNSCNLCSRKLDFIFLLNRLAVYSLPTAMSSLTGNHAMDLFYLLKENFKNLLFDLLITGSSFENLSYLFVRCHKDEDSEEYARTYYEILNQTLLTQKYQGSPPNTFYGLEAYDTHSAVACLKISKFFH